LASSTPVDLSFVAAIVSIGASLRKETRERSRRSKTLSPCPRETIIEADRTNARNMHFQITDLVP